MTLAVKNWFLEKNNLRYLRGYELEAKKETEKAMLVSYKFEYDHVEKEETLWIPKSCICNEWEKDVSPLGYHEYLLTLLYEAYDNGTIKHYTIDNGYNKYAGNAFYHQMKTAQLKETLDYYKVDYKSFKEWKER